MNKSLFQKIDCHSLPVPDLESAIAFYESLGHELIWRDKSGAGLRISGCEAELVLHTDDRPAETDFTVESVPEATAAFVEALLTLGITQLSYLITPRVYSKSMSREESLEAKRPGEIWSMAGELLNDMSEEQTRRIPRNGEHSVARCIEDVSMNLLVTGSPQVLYREDWLEPMKAIVRHTGSAVDVAGVAELCRA
jgi:hypothetical protein